MEALTRQERDEEIENAKMPPSQTDQDGIGVGTHKEKADAKSDACL